MQEDTLRIVNISDSTQDVMLMSRCFSDPEYQFLSYTQIDDFVSALGKNPNDWPQCIFIDESFGENSITRLNEWLSRFTVEKGKIKPTLILASNQGSIPEILALGTVDDILLKPIRPIDLLSKLRFSVLLRDWKSHQEVLEGMETLQEALKRDLKVAGDIQKRLFPKKFPNITGVECNAKYWVGLRAGGDYYDIFEFADKQHIGIFLSDSSGYKLSSALMSALIKLGVEEIRVDPEHSPSRLVQNVYREVLPSMREMDSLSVFLGILNLKSLKLNYTLRGTIQTVRLQRSIENGEVGSLKEFDELERGALLRKSTMTSDFWDKEIQLFPGDRLVVSTDGVADHLTFKTEKAIKMLLSQGSEVSAEERKELVQHMKLSRDESRALYFDVLKETASQEQIDLINELFFWVQNERQKTEDSKAFRFKEILPLPAEDCATLVLDINPRALRLA